MQSIIAVGVAGLLGTLARYWLSEAVDTRLGPAFPYGTLMVNLIGCFAIGFLFYAFATEFAVHPAIRSAIFIGFLGGFTTFSSFAVQTFVLLENGQTAQAAMNVAVSNVGGLFFVWVGYLVSRLI